MEEQWRALEVAWVHTRQLSARVFVVRVELFALLAAAHRTRGSTPHTWLLMLLLIWEGITTLTRSCRWLCLHDMFCPMSSAAAEEQQEECEARRRLGPRHPRRDAV